MPRKRYPSDQPDYRRRKAAGVTPLHKKKRGDAPAPAAARTRRSQSPPPSASAARKLPAPAIDFGAFTRPRGAAAAKRTKLPTLEQLAAEEAPELAAVTGGDCPRCHKPHGDDDRHCQFCGAPLRRVCGCGRPLRDDQQFCPSCGKSAPAVALEAPASDGDRAGGGGVGGAQIIPLHPPAPPLPSEAWDPDDLFWVSGAVDIALVKMDGDALDEEDRTRINTRAAVVANKHFRIGGKWKEEIKLGMAIAGAIFPTAYVYFVIAPRERAAALESKTGKEATK